MPRIHQQAPEVISFVLVDAYHRDPTTGKSYLLGTYSTIVAPSFPFAWERLCVYTSLVGGRGPTPIKLKLVGEASDDAALAEQETTVPFPGPLAVAEVTFTLAKVRFLLPGGYRLQLFCGEQMLREFRLHVAGAVAVQKGV